MLYPARMLRVVTALLTLATLSAPAFSWGCDGHKIVCAIAWEEMSESTRAQIRELLGAAEFPEQGCWADQVRSDPTYDWAKPLHYINVPRDARTVELARDGQGGKQILGAIDRYRGILGDKSKSKEERLEALRFLVHFVGDLHQPLHVSYEDDLGGNRITLESFGKKSNLHKVWDSDLIDHRLAVGQSSWSGLAEELEHTISTTERQRWRRQLDPLDWANDSLRLTRELYANLPNATGAIDEAYYKRFISKVESRLQEGGVHLGALLNATLDLPPVKVTPPKKATQ